ncbi:GNAT family N-acetyltransferase [bacterium]|nr:GNAT family N-acetyltransferase [bacterium]
MFEIETPRLRLIPLEFDYLEMLSNSRKELEEALGLNQSHLDFSGEYRVLRNETFLFWLENAHSMDTDYRWHTNWEVVLKDENRSIGGASFLGAPNRKGEVILGYIMDPKYRKNGYMSEAITEISNWALTFGGAKRVISFVEQESEAIDRLLKKCGFRKEVIYVKE